MPIDLEQYPALSEILKDYFGIVGCSECPFSRNPQDINLDDPDEGFYDCALLSAQRVWGEEPICERKDWAARARLELDKIAAKGESKP